jgi:hypothetical protein
MVLPHRDEIPRADDQRFKILVLLEDACHRCGHERLAESHHIADQHTDPCVQVMRSDLDGGHLEVKQFIAKVARQTKLHQTRTSFVRQVISHLEVDMVWGNRLLACPALLDNRQQFF